MKMREKVALGELCNPSLGQVKEQPDTLIDYIDISSVDNESKSITGFQTMSFAEAPSRARKDIKKNNILVSTVRPNLNAVAVYEEKTPNKTVVSTGFCVLDCKDNVDYRFVFNFCKSQAFIEDMVSQATGASYPAVSDKIVRSSMIPVYSYEEQCQISCILDTVSKIIADRKKELQKLDELIKVRFVELFGGGNYPQTPLIQLIVDDAGLSYGIIVPGDNVEDGVPMVRPSDFKNGELCLDNVYKVAPEIEAKYARTRLIGDEILVQVIGQPGQIMLSDSRCKGMNVTRNLAVVRPDCNRINRIYLKIYMQTQEAQAFMLGETKQSTLKQLPLGRLKELEVPVPPMESQIRFATFVEQTDKSKIVVQKLLEETQKLFNSLMQKYFG